MASLIVRREPAAAMPHMGFESLCPVDLASIEKVIAPHLQAMHESIAKEWPVLDAEMALLQLLCLRGNLKPPAWWPAHVRHPIIACMSRPSSLSKGQTRVKTTARRAIGCREPIPPLPSSEWASPEPPCDERDGDLDLTPPPGPPPVERYVREECGREKACTPATPETRASPDSAISDIISPRWKTCGSTSPEPEEQHHYLEQLSFGAGSRSASKVSRRESEACSELEVVQAVSDNPRVFEAVRPTSASCVGAYRSARLQLGEPHRRAAAPPALALAPGVVYPGAFLRKTRVRPESADAAARTRRTS